MSIAFQFDPLPKTWPKKVTPHSERVRAKFQTKTTGQTTVFDTSKGMNVRRDIVDVKVMPVGRTYQLLETELEQMGAEGVVHVKLDLSPRDFARTRWPKADARQPDHPGVIVEIPRKGGRLVYPCDKFDRWQDNLRAVAITLQRLRQVTLHGVLECGEQYIGSRALPPPGGSLVTPPMTVEDAAKFVSKGSGVTQSEVLIDSVYYRRAYRTTAARLHPDANGGITSQEWHTLQAAKSVLDAHYAAD